MCRTSAAPRRRPVPQSAPRLKGTLGRVGSRLLVALFASAILLFTVVGVAIVSHAGSNRQDVIHAPDGPFRGATMPSNVRAQQFKLTYQGGKTVSMSEYHGKPVVVTYLYTHCKETCPVA